MQPADRQLGSYKRQSIITELAADAQSTNPEMTPLCRTCNRFIGPSRHGHNEFLPIHARNDRMPPSVAARVSGSLAAAMTSCPPCLSLKSHPPLTSHPVSAPGQRATCATCAKWQRAFGELSGGLVRVSCDIEQRPLFTHYSRLRGRIFNRRPKLLVSISVPPLQFSQPGAVRTRSQFYEVILCTDQR